MYQIPVLSPSGRRELAADLPAEINPHLLWEVVRWQLAKRRRGTASTKTRGEVAYSGRKIWPQKHTGRARHGDIGAPIFVGGGVVFGRRRGRFWHIQVQHNAHLRFGGCGPDAGHGQTMTQKRVVTGAKPTLGPIPQPRRILSRGMA